MRPLGQRPVLIEETYRAILEAIADGDLAPGARVTQEELAARLQVSRQPVSHALVLLKQDGFLVESGRRGLEVAPLDPAYLNALYRARAALDAEAAGLAAEAVRQGAPGTKSGLAALDAAIAAQALAAKAQERPAMVAADLAFHRALNGLSGNPVIEEIATRQWGHMRRAMAAVLAEPAESGRVIEEHRAIRDAVAAGRAEAAGDAARGHVLRAMGQTLERLRERAAA